MPSTFATTRTDNALATGHSTLRDALNQGFQSAFLCGAVIASLGVVATLALIRTPRQQGSRGDVKPGGAGTRRRIAPQGVDVMGARPSGRAPLTSEVVKQLQRGVLSLSEELIG